MLSGLGYYVVHVPDAVRAKDFYRTVLGWQAEPGDDPKRYYHIEGSSPAGGIAGGASEPKITTYVLVDDAKAAAERIRELDGRAPEPQQSESGWSTECVDDQGTPFAIWQPSSAYRPDGPPKPGPGDLFYSVLPVADEEKAKRFYGTLFGWEFTPGSHPHGWNIAGVEPAAGMFQAGAPGLISVYFQVSDIHEAVSTIKAAGGTAGQVEPNAIGWHVACTDDQGLAFNLGSLRDG